MPIDDNDRIGTRYTTTIEYTDYQVTQQLGGAMVCAPAPPACTLGITGTSITHASVRGEADGTITIGISGNTGSTISWYLNGAAITGQTGTTAVFTGLTAGFYNVFAEEGECFVVSSGLQVIDGEFRTGDFLLFSPTGLTATENPIIFNLRTAQNTGTPAFSESNFQVTDTIDNNDYINITLEYPQAYTARFTARNFPNRDDYFLASTLKDGQGVTVGTNTATEIAKSIEEVLSKDVILNRLYHFRASGAYVYIIAKEQNSKLNLNSTNVTIVGDVTLTETVIGNSRFDGQITASYSLYCDIFVDEDAQYGTSPTIDNYNKVAQLELPFQANNQHLFDLSPILKNFVSTPKIDFSVSGFTTLADMMCSYRVQYGEKYPLVANSTTKKSRVKGITDALFSINSSLEWEESNNMDRFFGTGTTGTTMVNDVLFLSNSPSPKLCQRDGSEYLYIILPRDYGYPLKVVGDLYFYDGSILTGETLYVITTGTTNWGGVFGLAAGYNELNLSSFEVLTGDTTRKIRRVDFAIYQTSGTTDYKLTETRSYRYEIDEQPRKYGVVFLNSYGVWDIFDFSGEIVESVNHSNEEMEVARALGQDGNSPLGFEAKTVYNTKVTKSIAANTGWIDEAHFDWLQDLLKSNKVYCYTEITQPFLIVKSVNYRKSTNDDLFNIDVTFEETLEENNISI